MGGRCCRGHRSHTGRGWSRRCRSYRALGIARIGRRPRGSQRRGISAANLEAAAAVQEQEAATGPATCDAAAERKTEADVEENLHQELEAEQAPTPEADAAALTTDAYAEVSRDQDPGGRYTQAPAENELVCQQVALPLVTIRGRQTFPDPHNP